MTPFAWMAVVAGSMLTGGALVSLLVVRRRWEGLALVLGAAGMLVTLLAMATLTTASDRPAVTIAAALLSFGGFGGGYGLASALIGSLPARPHAVPGLPPGDPDGRVLVVVLVETEAEEYSPDEVTRLIAEFTDSGLPESSMSVLPFFYASHKSRYRAAGDVSPGLTQVRSLCESIGSLLDPGGFAGPVLVRCVDGSSLAGLMHAALEAGYRSACVVSPYVADPYRVDREKKGLDLARLDSERLSVAYTPPLWGSEAIAERAATRLLELVKEPDRTGVALVLEGQPGQRGHTHQSFDVQENAFANRVRMITTGEGIDAQRIRVCWDAWREPDVTETVRHLAALGCARVLVMPVSFPFDTLDTLLDLPSAARQARIPDEVNVVHLPAWSDDPVVASEIVRLIGVSTEKELERP